MLFWSLISVSPILIFFHSGLGAKGSQRNMLLIIYHFKTIGGRNILLPVFQTFLIQHFWLAVLYGTKPQYLNEMGRILHSYPALCNFEMWMASHPPPCTKFTQLPNGAYWSSLKMTTVMSCVTNVSYLPRERSVFVQERLEKLCFKKKIYFNKPSDLLP